MSTARPFLTAQWRSLVMANYVVDCELLQPSVPAGVELDLWQGQALVSLVGFRFWDTRVMGVPIPYHRHFEEVNLRFYVRRRVGEEWRRGVTFIRELVPRRAIAWTAKALYNEPYLALPMRHRVEGDRFQYEWRFQGQWQQLAARIAGDPQPLTKDSEEEFIFEHYWGYTRQRDGGTVEYEVEHPRWQAWSAIETSVTGNVRAIYGDAFGAVLEGKPQSTFVADGSAVTVRGAVRINPGG